MDKNKSHSDKVDQFIARTQVDPKILASVASDVFFERVKLEFLQNFGTCSLHELGCIRNHLVSIEFGGINMPAWPPGLQLELPERTKKKTKKKKRGKR